MSRLALLLLLLLLLLLAAAPAAAAGSFDCSAARSAAETAICASKEASARDFEVAEAYKQALRRLEDEPGAAAALKDDQRTFVRFRNDFLQNQNFDLERYLAERRDFLRAVDRANRPDFSGVWRSIWGVVKIAPNKKGALEIVSFTAQPATQSWTCGDPVEGAEGRREGSALATGGKDGGLELTRKGRLLDVEALRPEGGQIGLNGSTPPIFPRTPSPTILAPVFPPASAANERAAKEPCGRRRAVPRLGVRGGRQGAGAILRLRARLERHRKDDLRRRQARCARSKLAAAYAAARAWLLRPPVIAEARRMAIALEADQKAFLADRDTLAENGADLSPEASAEEKSCYDPAPFIRERIDLLDHIDRPRSGVAGNWGGADGYVHAIEDSGDRINVTMSAGRKTLNLHGSGEWRCEAGGAAPANGGTLRVGPRKGDDWNGARLVLTREGGLLRIEAAGRDAKAKPDLWSPPFCDRNSSFRPVVLFPLFDLDTEIIRGK